MRVTVAAFLMISCGVASLSLSGCGGASSVAPETGLQMRIQWPEVSRLLPDATQSVRVQVQDAGGFQTFRVANKPAGGGFSTLVFFGLKPGDLNVEARAFPAADAQGVALAQAAQGVQRRHPGQVHVQHHQGHIGPHCQQGLGFGQPGRIADLAVRAQPLQQVNQPQANHGVVVNDEQVQGG